MIKIDFQKEALKRREQNQYLLKQDLLARQVDTDLKDKIQKYATRYGLSENYVYDKLFLETDDMVFNGFEKDPWRQNIYEILQLEYIQKIEKETMLIQWVNKLSSGWKSAKYIKNGQILNLNKVERWDLKSLDFYWYYQFWEARLEFYTTCKYTQDDWWAQDNQANDVYSTFQEARQLSDENIVFIALVDGAYYYKKRWEWKAFFSYLNTQSNNWRCFCIDSDNVFQLIKTQILDWLLKRNWDIQALSQEIDRIQKIVF